MSVLIKGIVGLTGLLCLALIVALTWQPSLNEIHQNLLSKYPDLNFLPPEDLQQMRSEMGADVLIVDVREADEYAVSHLPGAINLPPNSDLELLWDRDGHALKAKHVVLYCSVGRRSAAMANAWKAELEALEVNSVSSLSGGIFDWVNQGRPLVGEKVHPYNRYWARLIENSDQVSFDSR